MKLKHLLIHSLCIAIVFVVTMVLVIPFPTINGYFNLSDLAIMIAMFLLSKYQYAFSLALGATLCDLVVFPVYAPMTFVIKSILAIMVLFLINNIKNKFLKSTLPYIIGGFFIGISYAGVDGFLFGSNVVIVSLLNNLVQGLCSSILSILVIPFLQQLKYYFEKFLMR